MQVNSAQDYLTRHKNRIIAKQYAADPQPATRRYNYVYTALVANKATQYVRHIAPVQPRGQAIVTYTSQCCAAQGTLPGSLI